MNLRRYGVALLILINMYRLSSAQQPSFFKQPHNVETEPLEYFEFVGGSIYKNTSGQLSVSVILKLKDGWKTFATAQDDKRRAGPIKTQIEIWTLEGKRLEVTFRSKMPPTFERDEELEWDIGEHTGLVEWTGDLNLGKNEDVDVQSLYLIGKIRFVAYKVGLGNVLIRRFGLVYATAENAWRLDQVK